MTPTITWATPAAITYGTALSATQLDATANAAGTFAYTPATGTVLTAGSQTLSVTFTPTNPTLYNSATASVTLTVSRAAPTITISDIPSSATYGGSFTVTYSYSGNGSPTESVSSSTTSVCTVSGNAVSYVGVGTCTLQASATATTDYTAVTGTTQSFAVSAAAPTISISSSLNPSTYESSVTFTATVPSADTNTVTFYSGNSSLGTATPSNGTATLTTSSLAVGTNSITASIAAGGNYAAATSSAINQVVNQTCGSNGYSYVRAITIDHTRVPNTDQMNFPFLFNTSDPMLKTTANNGHVANANGYDIIFTSDPAGQNRLPYEMEEYNPASGQVVAWVQIPDLSHTSDTTIYLFYGNPNVTTSQQNRSGVWDSNFMGVWHLANGTVLSTSDSTTNLNNGTDYGATAATGQIDGAASFNGNSYIDIGNMGAFPTQGTIEFWMQPSSLSSYPNAFTTNYNGGNNGIRFEENSDGDFGVAIGNGGFNGYGFTAGGLVPNAWYHIVMTWNTASSNAAGYINGTPAFNVNSSNLWPSTLQNVAIGSGYNAGRNWNGLIDEVQLSSTARSADWIATEYANDSSPGAFYSVSTENQTIAPSAVTLYSQQAQQFAVTPMASCNTVITWSVAPEGTGTLTQSGPLSALYTAPSSISTPQTVTVTAADQISGATIGVATIMLLPPPSISLVAVSQSPYQTSSSHGFIATVKDANGGPEAGISVVFSVAGANTNTGSAITDSDGIALFAYLGETPGTDTITASLDITGMSIVSNSVSVNWVSQTPTTGEGSITIQDQPAMALEGLLGAFTDSNGTVIQPLAIGAQPRVFVVPPGATQLQLGVDDDYFADNWGQGFVVKVNNNIVTVPAGAMPWIWVPGGLNASYAFGVQDGTSPIVAATNLTAAQSVLVAYQSGLNSPGGGFSDIYDANGVPGLITGTHVGSSGTYSPTYYMTSAFYPVSQPVSVSAVVTNGSGTPLANILVVLHVTGANPGEILATTNATGTAAFSYVGLQAGVDILKAEAMPVGEPSFWSSDATVTWVQPASLPYGSLTLSPSSVQPKPVGGAVAFSVYATDSFGSPVAGLYVSLVVSGADQMLLSGTTDSTGHAEIVYQNKYFGTASVMAASTINNLLTYSNTVTVPWTQPPATGNGTNTSSTLTVAISGYETVSLPNVLQLTGSATDTALPQGDTISYSWSSPNQPAAVTFANPQQASTTASFTQAGIYQLQLTATDENATASAQITVTVDPQPSTSQGWIGSPQNGALVSGIVPITVVSGETLTSCALTVYPAFNPNAVTALNCNSTSGQIATWDTTEVNNGSYFITLQATDSNGDSSYNLALVTVVGSYKPGRVTSTVTDLVVPSAGLAINIQRTYDSLNANTSGDFGYGWNLGINVNLTVDNKGNVTFTLGGQRRTFQLTPQIQGCSPLAGCLFPFFYPVFTPEPGLNGTLTDSSPGCPLDMMLADGECVGGGYYNPPGYIYTDPNGTQYTMSASGALQSIQDRSGNGLTVTPNGITSTTGLNVPFVRDSQGRITQITDPQENVYSYSYDSNGNLVSVTYPPTANNLICTGANAPNTSQYSYYTNPAHYYAGGTDANCNKLPTTTYYDSTTDGGNSALDGRLASVTDALNNTTSYAYVLSTTSTINGVSVPNTGVTIITYPTDPADGNGLPDTATMIYDSLGDLLQSTDPLGNITTNTYDANQNLLSTTDPLGHTTSYTYDSNGNKTSTTYPATATSTNTTSYTNYNQYSEPTSTTDELGNVRTFNYDVNYNPVSVTDSLGTLMSTQFNTNGTMAAGAIGYDITQNPGNASQFSYDANGNLICRVDALGRATSYSYNNLGQKVSMTEPQQGAGCVSPGNTTPATTTYQYDPFGNLIQTSAPIDGAGDMRITYSQYDGNGNKTSDTDARGYKTSYQYDALNRLIETDYPGGTKVTKTYDFRGNVVDEWDQANDQTHHVFDLAGRQTSVTQAYGTSSATTTQYTYDNDGRKTSVTVGSGASNAATTYYTYDAAGNLTGVSGAGGSFTYGYDNARNRISMTDGKNNKTVYQYDARKRLVETDYPDTDQTSVKNSYDGPGNLISVTDQAQNVVQYAYDVANQLINVVQANSPNSPANTTFYGYDPLGNAIALEDAKTHSTLQSFDLLSELTTKKLPDGTLTETRTYDSNGNLASVTHFNSTTTTYSYDQLNRLTQRATPGETTVNYTYTQTGKRQTMTDASGTTTYTYDSMDRLTHKQTPEGTLNYSYDAAGNLATMQTADGAVNVSYTWNSLNLLEQVADSRLGTTGHAYDNANNVGTVTYPNGVQSTFAYDALNRVTGLSSQSASYTYQRGPTGNLISATESSGRQVSWNYDGIYRLTNEIISSDPANHDGNVSYGLDPVGNRTSVSGGITGLSPIAGSFNVDDELASESYDSNGNVTSTGGKNVLLRFGKPSDVDGQHGLAALRRRREPCREVGEWC